MRDKLETTTQTGIICVTVDWDNDQSRDTLCYRFIGMWEWYDFSQASTQAFRMMSEVSHDVSVIFDMRLSLDIPVGAMRAIRRFMQFSPPNMDIVVVASDDRLTQLTFVMLIKLDHGLRRYITFARTCEEAKKLLKQYHAQQAG